MVSSVVVVLLSSCSRSELSSWRRKRRCSAMTAASRLVAPAAGTNAAIPAVNGMSGGGPGGSGGRLSVTGEDTRTVSRPLARPPMAEVLKVMRRVCGAGAAVSCMVAERVENVESKNRANPLSGNNPGRVP